MHKSLLCKGKFVFHVCQGVYFPAYPCTRPSSTIEYYPGWEDLFKLKFNIKDAPYFWNWGMNLIWLSLIEIYEVEWERTILLKSNINRIMYRIYYWWKLYEMNLIGTLYQIWTIPCQRSTKLVNIKQYFFLMMSYKIKWGT